MSSQIVDHEGHTLEIDREMIDVTLLTEQDPNWTFTDAAGHRHFYVSDRPEGPYPSLEYRPYHGHADDEGDECDYDGDQDVCWPVLVCHRCGERVSPGTRPGMPKQIPGLTTYLIDGEPVSKQAAEDFLSAMQAEREAAGPQVASRPRPVGFVRTDPATRETKVFAPEEVQYTKDPDAVQRISLESVHRQGLLAWLSKVVGADAARMLIREAAVNLDPPPVPVITARTADALYHDTRDHGVEYLAPRGVTDGEITFDGITFKVVTDPPKKARRTWRWNA